MMKIGRNRIGGTGVGRSCLDEAAGTNQNMRGGGGIVGRGGNWITRKPRRG